MRATNWFICALFMLGWGTEAYAARTTDLASTFDKKGLFNLDLRVGYERSLRRGAIRRELAGRNSDAIAMVKDLRFTHYRHTLNLRADVTILKALQLSLGFPIVLADSRYLDFAQNDGDACTGDTGRPEDNCVTPLNSTLSRDGFINHAQMAPNQIAVAGPDGVPGGFTLPNRAGLDQIHIGLTGAPLSQQRDDTKPTWVIGLEARIAVGKSMEYNPFNPTGNTAVGRGVHEFRWWTAVSRRFKYLDPWMTIEYFLPATQDGSLLDRTSFPLSGQERSGPRHRGGFEIGLEIIPWEKPKKEQRLSIELSTRFEAVFEGRDYSPMWEVFANSPMLTGICRSAADSVAPQSWNNGSYCGNPGQPLPYPGITNMENFAVFGGKLGVAVELSRYFRANIGVSLAYEQQHFITFADAGKAKYANTMIDLRDESQVNPMYRPYIDSVGRRFSVAESTIFDFYTSITGQF